MRLQGSYAFPAPRPTVWAALLDPAELARALPGCETLEAVGQGEYRTVMKVGVASVKGTFEGTVRVTELEPPARYRMAVEGQGSSGFVRGTASLELGDIAGGTRVTYDADVLIGGLIAGVGQRMLAGVARHMLDQFFSRMTHQLAHSA